MRFYFPAFRYRARLALRYATQIAQCGVMQMGKIIKEINMAFTSIISRSHAPAWECIPSSPSPANLQ